MTTIIKHDPREWIKLNGWTESKMWTNKIVEKLTGWDRYRLTELDHLRGFIVRRKNDGGVLYGLLNQPYANYDRAYKLPGCQILYPPNPYASFHNMGSCLCMCVLPRRLKINVKWMEWQQ